MTTIRIRRAALAAALLAGTATPALADDKPEEKVDRVTLKEGEPRKPAASPRAPDGWVELATPTPARHGTEYITVGQRGDFSTLRLEATRGKVVFERVVVTFADDTIKVFERRKLLHPRDPAIAFELGGKPIKRLVVTTERYTDGDYAVFASTAPVTATR
ncbi:MAG: hypothetical protein KF773_34530 [Deltaproteobacteria bacterium]|nr:hypothetical protein [Deltaproteobacteria bacterium]